jgi:RAT1-interacting protein
MSEETFEAENEEEDCLLENEDYASSVTPEAILEKLMRSLIGKGYQDVAYWNSRYLNDSEGYEWFQSWTNFFPFLRQYVPAGGRALNIGSGSSPMSLEMLNSGLSDIVSIDISDVVIEQMRSRYSAESRLKWEVMDCQELRFSDNSFDLVVDKGTIDALYCCDQCERAVTRTLSEIRRVLKPSSFYIDISFAKPKHRKQIMAFESPDLGFLELISVPNPRNPESFHYIYVFKRE